MVVTVAYEWRHPRAADADVVGSELEKIEANHGQVTAKLFVRAATPVESPLHSLLEWDEAQAANRYREHQARAVIRSLRVVRPGMPVEQAPPAYVRVIKLATATEPRTNGYVSTVRAMGDGEMQAFVLRQAMEGLLAWRARYGALADFAAVVEAIDQVQAGVADLL